MNEIGRIDVKKLEAVLDLYDGAFNEVIMDELTVDDVICGLIDQLKECREENVLLHNERGLATALVTIDEREQLKKCREENKIINCILNHKIEAIDKVIEQRTREAIKKKILEDSNIKTPVTGRPYVLWEDVERAINEAKGE